METENGIREEIEERAEGVFPEEEVENGYPQQEAPDAPEETADSWEPDAAYGSPVIEPPDTGKPEKKTFLRASGSWTDILPIAAILSVIVMLIGEIISSILIGSNVIPARDWGLQILGDADSVEFLLQYFGFFGIWIAFMLVALVFRNNWPMWKAFFYNGHGNNLKAIPIGILLGFGLNGFCVLMSCIMGDIKLSFNEFRPLAFFAFLLCVWIQSGAEEIIDRCYLYQKLRRRYRWPVIAVLGNSLVFMALHMGNPSVTAWGLGQVFLFGVLASLIVYYWDSLWTAIWMHTAWNFSQSVVFGLPNSGIVSKYSVFKLEAASARDGLFYTTGFGVEGSKGANAIMAALIVIILIYGLATKRGEMKDHWEELEEREAGKSHIWEAVVLTVLMIAVLAGGVLFARWWNENGEAFTQALEQVEAEQEQEQLEEQEPALEEPVTEEPFVEVPAVEVPGAETPAAEQPGAEAPAEEPAVEQPAGEEQPAEQGQPAAETPAEQGQPQGQEQPAEQPAAEQQTGNANGIL